MTNGWLGLGVALAVSLAALAAVAEEEGSSSSPPTPARPQGTTMTLRMADGSVLKQTMAGLPYVDFYSGPVMAPGEAMTVRFAPGEALADSKFVRIRPADAAFAASDAPAAMAKAGPAGTLVITYVQEAGSPGMILRFDHRFGRAVAYDVQVEHYRNGEWKAEDTTPCTMRPGETHIRRFADPTRRLFFHRFHYAANAELAATCS